MGVGKWIIMLTGELPGGLWERFLAAVASLQIVVDDFMS